MVGEFRHMSVADLALALQGPEVDRLRLVVTSGNGVGNGPRQGLTLSRGIEKCDTAVGFGLSEGLAPLLFLGEDRQDRLFVGLRILEVLVDVDGFNHGMPTSPV